VRGAHRSSAGLGKDLGNTAEPPHSEKLPPGDCLAAKHGERSGELNANAAGHDSDGRRTGFQLSINEGFADIAEFRKKYPNLPWAASQETQGVPEED